MLIETDLAVSGDQRLMAFLERAVDELGSLGARMEIAGDFSAFQSVDRVGAHSVGTYHPDLTNAVRGTSIIIYVGDRAIATYAGAMFDTYERSMADVFSHHGPYRDESADRIEFLGDARDLLECASGRVLYSGGIWVHPDHRKTPLSRFLVPFFPLAGRMVGLGCWGVQHIITFVEGAILTKGVASRYRHWLYADGVVWHHDGHEIGMSVGYTSPIQAIYEGNSFVKLGAGYLERTSLPFASPMGNDLQKAA